tara:strand:+ start:1613 stop:2407 length:795 start_codon:yes stop_codon:yes gene_type:complete
MLKKLVMGKRVAIVGPSPHIIGKKQRSYIDSFDIVIRINELGISEHLFEDYGSKTDIVFLTLHKEALNIYKEMIRKNDLSSICLIVNLHHEYNLQPYLKKDKTKSIFEQYKDLNLPINLEHLGNDLFFERCKLFKCFPSTGSMAIYELAEMQLKELYVTGFSFYTTKFKYNQEKNNLWKMFGPDNQNILRASGHDTKKEVQFLRMYFKKNDNVNIHGDKVFKKIILSKMNWYYPLKSFFTTYINFDYYKNQIKLLLRLLGVPKY